MAEALDVLWWFSAGAIVFVCGLKALVGLLPEEPSSPEGD